MVRRFWMSWVCFFWLVCAVPVHGMQGAQATGAAFELPAGVDHHALNAYAHYLLDPDGTLQVGQAIHADRWQQNATGAVLNFGFTSRALWIRERLVLPPGQPGPWYLVIPYPLLEHVDLFVQRNGVFLPVPRAQEDGAIRSPYVQFVLPDTHAATVDFMLRVQSFASLQAPLELWSHSYLVNHQNAENMVWGLYYGALLALLAYNAFLFISVRDVAYLYYVLYLAAQILLMLCLSGFGPLYFWHSVSVARYALPVATGLTSLWSVLFTLAFLRGCGLHPGLRKTLWIMAGASVLLVLHAFTGSDMGAALSGLLGALTLLVVIVAGLNALATGAAIARYFNLAWTTFALGALIYLLNVFDLVPVSQFTTHAIQGGSALEALLLSFALAHRIKEERQHKLAALEQKADVERCMKQEQELALERALHDSLSARPNDALLMQRVQELLPIQESAGAFALVLFYCPQLKEISSSLGRRLAEEVFCSVVEDMNRLMAADTQSICIEQAGHSFVAVTEFGSLVSLCRITDGQDSVYAYAQRCLSLYERQVDIDGVLLNLDIVCGMACHAQNNTQADLLLQHAAAARDFGLRTQESITLYNAEIEAFGRRRLLLIGALSQAMRDHELELYLQPQVHADTLVLEGAEALLRWNSPRFGAVPPQEFVDVAEQAGLIDMLTRHVVEQGFALLKQLQQEGLEITLSLNLSIQNLVDESFVTFVTTTAAALRIRLSAVVLEVTETSASDNMDQVIESLRQLAAAGCRIALDDFGTGYSSLAYLSRLPIHELKIDRSFIKQMNRSANDFRIVDNTIKLARALQIQTVAEGVEDALTLSQIARLGCDRVQGYYIARPMPLAQFRARYAR